MAGEAELVFFASVFPQFTHAVDGSKSAQQKESPALRPTAWMGHTGPQTPNTRKPGQSWASAWFCTVLSLLDQFSCLLTCAVNQPGEQIQVKNQFSPHPTKAF